MRIQLVLLAALGALALPALLPGCTAESCENSCLEQYDDCLARSPPGASKADCGATYDSCMQVCSSSNDAPPTGANAAPPSHSPQR